MIDWSLGLKALPLLKGGPGWYRRVFGKKISAERNVVYTPIVGIFGERRLDGTSLFLRLKVPNPTAEAALNVEVSVAAVGERQPDGHYVRARADDYPKPLLWSNTTETSLPVLHRGPGRTVDVAHIHEPVFRTRLTAEGLTEEPTGPPIPERTVLFVQTQPGPLNRSHIFPPGSYQFEIVVSASNISPVYVTADVDLSGQWQADNVDAVVRYVVRPGKAAFVS